MIKEIIVRYGVRVKVPDPRMIMYRTENEEIYLQDINNLPQELSAKSERACLVDLYHPDEAHRKTARVALLYHNLRLVSYIAKRYLKRGFEYRELLSIGTIGLIKAMNTFDLNSTVKFGTYAGKCIHNEIRMALRSNKKRDMDISIEETIGDDDSETTIGDLLPSSQNIEKDIECECMNNALYDVINLLSEKEKKVICMRYGLFGNEEMTQSDVADVLGVSQSYLSRLEKRIIKKLRIELKHIGIDSLY